ncbi:hypothetical protein D3C79_636140 [compost metagenome]
MFQYQRHLSLTFGLHEAGPGDRLAVADFHAIEQCAEVRLIHTQLLLHRVRGQTDLAPGDTSPGTHLALGIELLHLVGVGDGIKLIAHRRHRFTTFCRLVEQVGHLLMSFGHCSLSWSMRTQTLVSSE